MIPTSARAALHGLIDYAGLFPPAAQSMDAAVRAYAEYRESAHAWMLGRFICPAARLDEFAASVAPHLSSASGPWRLSVLLGSDVERDLSTVAALNAAHQGVNVDAVETRAGSADEIARIGRAARSALVATYVEIPVADNPSALLEAIGRAGVRAKIRTGGVTADAFPSAADVARFLGACVRQGVAFKATAGLHHPLRGEYRLTYDVASACGTMFGFLNVVLAAAWLRDGASDTDVVTLLEAHDATEFAFSDAGVRWRDVLLLTARLEQLRDRGLISIGSCSFTEPVHEVSFIPGWAV